MRDLIRRYSQYQRDYKRAAKKGVLLEPVRMYNPKRITSIEAPEGESPTPVERPMSMAQIRKQDPDGIKMDGKNYSAQSEPKVFKWWAYLSDPSRTPERKSQVVIGGV